MSLRRRLAAFYLHPSFFFVLAAFSVLCYLAASRMGGFLGFALDDAWIHQTYARNLAQRFEFSFVPGQVSAGSTSPLWTLLLAAGYALRFNPLAWTYALGAALLGLSAWLTYRLTLAVWPEHPTAARLAGVMVAVEWHMVWAAVSGMETLLLIALVLAAFVIPARRAGWLGVVVGASVLARPDGLSLLPFVAARLLLPQAGAGPRRWRQVLWFALGFALLFGPYLGFNAWLAGSVWPNTFYAKQAEYAIYRQLPLLQRLASLALQPFVGAQILLVPGIVAAAWVWARGRRWEALLTLGWLGAFLAAFVLRLPVTYQHGRYLMPMIPALLVAGVGGSAHWLGKLNQGERAGQALSWRRLTARTWVLAMVLVTIAFWGVGAKTYLSDVQIIETEMVWPARWISQNTPPGALIAAHDIGALGYFGQRNILDMAGLVSPEVIPFIRDERQLGLWLGAKQADYLMTFPGWYPDLVQSLAAPRVYPPPGMAAPSFSVAAGGENMAVYRLR